MIKQINNFKLDHKLVEFLLLKGIYTKFLVRTISDTYKTGNMLDVFLWSKSPEGHTYWAKLQDECAQYFRKV